MPQMEAKSCNQQTELRHLLRVQEQAFRRMGNNRRSDDADDSDFVKKEAKKRVDSEGVIPSQSK